MTEKLPLNKKYFLKCVQFFSAVGLLACLSFFLASCSEKAVEPVEAPESIEVKIEETIKVGYWIPESAANLPEWQLSERKNVWQKLLPENVRFSDSSDLPEFEKERISLVIVAYAEEFTEAEAAASKEYLQRGGDLLFNGWIGTGSSEKDNFSLMKKVLQN